MSCQHWHPYNDDQNLRMTTLIVVLPSEPADPAALYDYLLTADGNSVGEQSRAPLALLPLVDRATEVVALVPTRKLSWHQVQLPKGSLGRNFLQEGGSSRLRAVLAGLLEEQLLDETELLHFALQPQARTDQPAWVAVCERGWLQAALKVLEQSGRPVQRIVPEFAPDTLADTLYVVGVPDQAHLVFGAGAGVAAWPVSKAAVALLNWPALHGIVAEPAVASLAEELFKRSVTLQQGAQRRLQAIASAWDLAQFDLVNSGGARTWRRWSEAMGSLLRAPRWRAVRLTLLALLAINLVGLNSWAWHQQAQLDARRGAIRDVLTSTFPQVRVVVDAPLQMAREVAALQQAGGQATVRDMDVMMDALGLVVPAGKVPSAIEFTPGELRVKGLSAQPEDITALSFRLKPQAYVAGAEGDSLVIRPMAIP